MSLSDEKSSFETLDFAFRISAVHQLFIFQHFIGRFYNLIVPFNNSINSNRVQFIHLYLDVKKFDVFKFSAKKN